VELPPIGGEDVLVPVAVRHPRDARIPVVVFAPEINVVRRGRSHRTARNSAAGRPPATSRAARQSQTRTRARRSRSSAPRLPSPRRRSRRSAGRRSLWPRCDSTRCTRWCTGCSCSISVAHVGAPVSVSGVALARQVGRRRAGTLVEQPAQYEAGGQRVAGVERRAGRGLRAARAAPGRHWGTAGAEWGEDGSGSNHSK
jgi:hypothetical protein